MARNRQRLDRLPIVCDNDEANGNNRGAGKIQITAGVALRVAAAALRVGILFDTCRSGKFALGFCFDRFRDATYFLKTHGQWHARLWTHVCTRGLTHLAMQQVSFSRSSLKCMQNIWEKFEPHRPHLASGALLQQEHYECDRTRTR